MGSGDAVIRKRRHFLLHGGAFVSATTETLPQSAADRGAILGDPNRLSEICASVLNSNVTEEMMIMKNKKWRD